MVYMRGVMLHPSMARLATVENLCNILPTWFIQKPKARARCSGLIAVCPESLHACPPPYPGQTIYRVFSDPSRMLGPFWTPNNPANIRPIYSIVAGLPAQNLGTTIVTAAINDTSNIVWRSAKRIGFRFGGLCEYEFKSLPASVSILGVRPF